jgi:hypothetical protein
MSGTTEPGPLERRLARKKAQQELRDRKIAQGLAPLAVAALPNRKSEYGSVEEEQQARQEAITTQWQIMGGLLPVLLARLEKIPDPRQPKKIKHKMTMVLLYGIMMFVHQMSSRREANQKMTHPQFMENLALAFPDLDQIPHHDTLNRLLSAMDVDQIPEAHIELLRRLIRKKKFVRYLIDGRYPVAIDGTQKLVRAEMLSEEWLQRYAKDEERATQYYVYTLEANLALRNGMSIPLTTEFLVYSQGDIEHNKQDCELRAFKRIGTCQQL